MKTFKIENNENNQNWVNANLDTRDFTIEENEIVIGYFNEMQKSDILEAISNLVEETYDVVFNDDENSNNKGFSLSKEDAISYVKNHNGTSESYFADYKGGLVQVVSNNNQEVVFEEEVK